MNFPHVISCQVAYCFRNPNLWSIKKNKKYNIYLCGLFMNFKYFSNLENTAFKFKCFQGFPAPVRTVGVWSIYCEMWLKSDFSLNVSCSPSCSHATAALSYWWCLHSTSCCISCTEILQLNKHGEAFIVKVSLKERLFRPTELSEQTFLHCDSDCGWVMIQYSLLSSFSSFPHDMIPLKDD